MTEEVESLMKEMNSLMEVSHRILEATPDFNNDELENQLEKDIVEDINLIGDSDLTHKLFDLLDNEKYEEAKRKFLEQPGLSENEFRKFVEHYVAARLIKAVQLYEYEYFGRSQMERKLNKVENRMEKYDHYDTEDAVFALGLALESVDNQRMLMSQKRATQAENCMEYFGLEVSEDSGIDPEEMKINREIQNFHPEEVISDIRAADREIQDLQNKIESLLGMSRDEILDQYQKERENNSFLD